MRENRHESSSEFSSMARPADSLAAMNERLKGAGIRLKVMARGNKLYLRGTLPPKKGETKPKQRYLSLGLDDTPYGLKTAELKAHELWSQLGQGTFQWETWTETEQDTCQAWIDRYKRHWFAVNGDTPQTQTKWKRQEWQMGLRWLPPSEKISSTVLETTVLNRPPNSRARQLCIQVLNRFAEYAAVEVDFDKYRGKYTKRKKPLEIPSDEDIARLKDTISTPQWRLVYARMAVYGLRDHECWFCEINPEPPYDCRVLDGKTGPRDGVMPFYPEWAEQWKPWQGTLPKVTDTVGDRAIYGERTARAFKRHKIPFTPYTLRHAWCIRASVVFKQPIPVSAAMAGHSADLHLRTYNRWLKAAQSLEAYKEAIEKGPKAPQV
jgi:integrase